MNTRKVAAWLCQGRLPINGNHGYVTICSLMILPCQFLAILVGVAHGFTDFINHNAANLWLRGFNQILTHKK
jgi:hypothetical protein